MIVVRCHSDKGRYREEPSVMIILTCLIDWTRCP